MTNLPPNRPGPKLAVPPSEQGYVILLAIFLVALLVIALAIAAPQVAKSIQRDKDLETWHRGMQYRRAIQLYYRKFHAYPPNADALVQTNNIRFLRKKYIDPITGKVDWKPILFGQNKVPTALGFFGQPLAGSATTIAGIGPSGGNGLNSGSTGGILPGGISDILGGGPTAQPLPAPPAAQPTTPATPTAAQAHREPTPRETPSTGSTSSTTGSSSGSDQSGQSGQAFGGAGIIGFSPASDKKSIIIYKKKNHFNEWEFTYDPISDMKTMSGGNAGGLGQPASSTSTPVGTPTFGSSTQTPPTSTTTTQQ